MKQLNPKFGSTNLIFGPAKTTQLAQEKHRANV
jgi:hypothetical protein